MNAKLPPALAGISLSDWRQQARYFSCGGHRIAWWEAGSGEPLLLIHGFPTAAWDWNLIWPELAKRYRVIALDLLGYGLSDKPWPHVYRIAEQADLAQTLMRSLDLDRYHLLAHDYGDTVAQELLARHEEAPANQGFLLSLCLLNGGLFPETHRPVLAQKLLLSPLGPVLAGLFNRGTLARNLRKIFGPQTPPSASDLNGFWQLLQEQNGRRVFPGLIRYMEERRTFRERWVGALQKTKVPLRLINGSLDPISGAHMADRFLQLVPDGDLVRLPEVGHYPQVEAPEAVLMAYLEFRKNLEFN